MKSRDLKEHLAKLDALEADLQRFMDEEPAVILAARRLGNQMAEWREYLRRHYGSPVP